MSEQKFEVKVKKLDDKKKNYSLIVGDRDTIISYRQLLDNDSRTKNGYNIDKMFKDNGFKLTKNTWVMEHSEKFEVMKKVITKNDIKMKSGKKVHLISANIYLEVMKGLY